MLLVLLYSLFDGNRGADGAAINLAYYNVNFDNVTFSNNVGSAVRVSEIILHQDTVVCRAAQVNGASANGVSISYSMVVLYIGINKVWDFLPKNPTKKSAKYLLSDSMAALVRHSQAQKCLQINSKPLH